MEELTFEVGLKDELNTHAKVGDGRAGPSNRGYVGNFPCAEAENREAQDMLNIEMLEVMLNPKFHVL